MSDVRRIAAIDIGTVTTRLLVADVAPGRIGEVFRSTDITHLGEDLTTTCRLSVPAMQRVAAVISRYAEKATELHAVTVRAVATSASRDAENGDEFVELLASVGVEPTIIAGDTEAALSFSGATFAAEGEGLLVVDVGGGSTELVVGSARWVDDSCDCRVDAARSIDVGSRRATELFLRSDPPTSAELAAAREWMTAELRPYFDALRSRPTKLLALAGAATTLSAIHLELAHYDADIVHGSVLTGSDLAEITAMLARMPLAKRRDVVGLHPERAQVIVGGALVLETALALSGLDELTVSEHDILYGILLDTYADLRKQTEA